VYIALSGSRALLAVQMSGINLLQFKSGVVGQPCYQRYLLEAYKLIHGYGGGLYYFAEVYGCAKPAVCMY
jgi:hypothetical protein